MIYNNIANVFKKLLSLFFFFFFFFFFLGKKIFINHKHNGKNNLKREIQQDGKKGK